MRLDILNPTYKELIAIEEYHNKDMEKICMVKHGNNLTKVIISIFAVAM